MTIIDTQIHTNTNSLCPQIKAINGGINNLPIRN